MFFTSWFFYRVFTKLQIVFYRFKKFELVFEIWPVKVGPHQRFPIGKENENSEKRLLYLKFISSYILKQFSSNF